MRKFAYCLILASTCMFGFVGCQQGATDNGGSDSGAATATEGGDAAATPDAGGDKAAADTGAADKAADKGAEEKK